jgi:DNA-binding transcriptional MerR regulator
LDNKAPEAFRTISEVADDLDLPQHVLRFWETRFRDIKPMKRGGGRRFYRPDDIDLLRGIRHLLYGEGYTIRGVQRILREQGIKFVQAVWTEGAPQPPHGASEEDTEEEMAAVVEAPEEEGGLRGRLAAFIGRDLGDNDNGADGRRDPPLHGAPVPHIDADDRALHGAAQPAPAEIDDEVEEELPVAAPPAPAEPPPAATGREALTREEMGKLHAALHELGECRRLIEAAVARPE